jgi:hypothetical protein
MLRERRHYVLRLFIWKKVWCDYTCGVAFALALTADDARRLVLDGMKDSPLSAELLARELTDEPEVYEQPYGFGVMGGG